MRFQVSPELINQITEQTKLGGTHERLREFRITGLFARHSKDVERECPECENGITTKGRNRPAGLPCQRCDGSATVGKPSRGVLRHRGVDAIAIARISNPRELALGVSDGVITVDEFRWGQLSDRSKVAAIDHELTHFEVTEATKLKMRPHEFEVGWFSGPVARHGDASIERIQAAKLLATPQGQLFFPGMAPASEDKLKALVFDVVSQGPEVTRVVKDLVKRRRFTEATENA